MFTAATLDDLLRQVFAEILAHGATVEGSRGSNKEITSALLRLTDPLARLSHTETKGKLFSALGELAWYLAASDDGDFITYYIKAYEEEDNIEIDGTVHGAYGPRLFTAGWHNQFENVARLLRQKPSTKKAVIQLFDCADLAGTYKDVPCTCTLQFLIRADRLDLIVVMRSNDAFWGLPHDVFSFTMLQEIMARTLGRKLGQYTHFAASLHLYERHYADAESFMDEKFQGTVGAAMPPMPPGKPWPSIRAFLKVEAALRAGLPIPKVAESLDPYWQDLIRLLRVVRHAKNHDIEAISRIKDEMASRVYREYITAKEKHKPPATPSDQRASERAGGDAGPKTAHKKRGSHEAKRRSGRRSHRGGAG